MSTPSYKTHDPKGWCGDPKRGAALGRGTWLSPDHDAAYKIVICKVEIDSGGYDVNGTYFGIGNNLWWFATEDGTIDTTMRASDYRDVHAAVQSMYPNATITRGETIEIPCCDECGEELESTGYCESCLTFPDR